MTFDILVSILVSVLKEENKMKEKLKILEIEGQAGIVESLAIVLNCFAQNYDEENPAQAMDCVERIAGRGL